MNLNELVIEDMMIDRIVINVYSMTIPQLSLQEYTRIAENLQEDIFTVKNQQQRFHKFKFRDSYDVSGEAHFWFDQGYQSAGLTMSISMNPTRSLRKRLDATNPPNIDRSLDGGTNFLPEKWLGALTRKFLQDWCYEQLCSDIQHVIDDLQSVISHAAPNSNLVLTGSKTSIEGIELYWDVPAEGAIMEASRLADRFHSYFRNAFSHLHPLTHTSTGMTENAPSMLAEIMSGESLRIYAKTPSTMRFELILKKNRIRGLRGSNSLPELDRETVKHFCYSIAEQPLEHLNQFLLNLEKVSITLSQPNLLHKIARCCKRNLFLEVIQVLAARGGLKYSERFGSIVYRLVDAGVLYRVRRGVYAISMRHQRVLRQYLEKSCVTRSSSYADSDWIDSSPMIPHPSEE